MGLDVIRTSDMQRGRQTFLALVLQSGSSSLSGLKFLSSTKPLPEATQIFLKYGARSRGEHPCFIQSKVGVF